MSRLNVGLLNRQIIYVRFKRFERTNLRIPVNANDGILAILLGTAETFVCLHGSIMLLLPDV